jgi:SulP family sulfate permease
MLRALIQELKKDGISFAVAGAIGPARDIFYHSRLIDEIGPDNFFADTYQAYTYCRAEGSRSEMEAKIATQAAGRNM